MAKKTYEDNLKELEEIMRQFETNELTLDETLSKYQKALNLIKEMEKTLNEAQGKLIEIQEKSN